MPGRCRTVLRHDRERGRHIETSTRDRPREQFVRDLTHSERASPMEDCGNATADVDDHADGRDLEVDQRLSHGFRLHSQPAGPRLLNRPARGSERSNEVAQ